MLPNLTPAALRALDAAQRLAAGLGCADVQPAHLLQGLLEEEQGRAAELVVQAGLSLPAFKEACPDPRPGRSSNLAEASYPLSAQARMILEYAGEVAVDHSGERTVASDHILLALIRKDKALRLQLESLGLSLVRLESSMLAPAVAPLRLDEPLVLADTTEQMDTARILDASGNRAREALRVLEDYCRFSLDDPLLCKELKHLRHDLAELLTAIPLGSSLEARDTLGDVGTVVSTADERERHSLQAVVAANWKRLQEALRSLEEYGKLRSPVLGQALEKLRYRSYVLERTLLLGAGARHRLADASLYVLVTGSLCVASLDWTIQEAAAGGANMIQLREKDLDDKALLERARQVRKWTRQAGVLFIMNDRPDLARLAEADGVHLGQEDLPVKEARRILGPGALVGVSTHNLEQVRQAVLDGVSYVGIGPTFASSTKSFTELPGLEFVHQVAAETTLPAFAIGGVNLNTIESASVAGARRVAVSAAICRADDPRLVAGELRRALQGLNPRPTDPAGSRKSP